jgi:hypothetical protein
MGTIPGLGFLREAPRPQAWFRRPRSPAARAAEERLTKCRFLPVDGQLVARYPRDSRADDGGRSRSRSGRRRTLLDDPLVIGVLLALVPPVGMMLLWTNPRYETQARVAISVVLGLTLTLGTMVVFALAR